MYACEISLEHHGGRVQRGHRLDGNAGDGANGINSVTYKPHEDLDPGVNRVQLTVRDRDGRTVTRDWSFRVR
jgi:hypothetical protein